jgi:hypothetical protein
MYGEERTKAFCCNCKELTMHEFTNFSSKKVKSPRKESWLERLLSGLISSEATGDYKCTKCGTYLSTPDNLD